MFDADKKMDHANYPKSLRSKDIGSLQFIIQDCKESIEANPENPNNSFYQDEILYCAAEIRRRQTPAAKAKRGVCQKLNDATCGRAIDVSE